MKNINTIGIDLVKDSSQACPMNEKIMDQQTRVDLLTSVIYKFGK